MCNNDATPINQFGNSDYDALWDGVTGDIMHKPNGDIPRDLWHNFELSNWLIVQKVLVLQVYLINLQTYVAQTWHSIVGPVVAFSNL